MDVSDGERDLPPQLLLVELHPHDLVREPLVEQPVDLGAARELECVHCRRSRSFDGALKILLKLLDAPIESQVLY